MGYRGFGRGRGYGSRGTCAKGRFGRPRFPHIPFRHAGPRPGHPAFMPWQPNNSFYQIQLPHANPQVRPRGRGRRICTYGEQFPSLISVPTFPGCEEVIIQPPPPPPLLPLSPDSSQVENRQTDDGPQPPLLGSEEERQRKITETADRLKQKLSAFNNDEVTVIWNDDVPSSSNTVNDGCIESRGIPELRYEPPELNLTYNDLKDIGRINSNNSRLNISQHMTNIFSVNLNTDNEIILNKNDECELEAISNKMTDLEILSDNNKRIEAKKYKFRNSIDKSNNSEQSNLCEDKARNGLLETDIQSHDALENKQEYCKSQQDIIQKIVICPTDVIQKQNTSQMPYLQDIPLPTGLTEHNILQKDVSQSKKESVTNLEISNKKQETVLSSCINTKNLDTNNCTLSQSSLADASISNNVILDNHQLLRSKKISFHSGPPKLSPPTERELPIDFDPSTPPPILLKQDQSRTLPPFPMYDLPLLFDPTEPPPNIKRLLKSKVSHDNSRSIWNVSTENQIILKNRDINIELNEEGDFQRLPLEMSSQNNVFLPSCIDTISVSSLPSNHHPRTETQQVPRNTYVSSSFTQEPLSFTDSHRNTNKHDGLNNMQGAFAKQMTIEKKDEESNSTSLSRRRTLIQPVNDIESISLPSQKSRTQAKLKTRRHDKYNRKSILKECETMGYISPERTMNHLKSMDVSLMDQQDHSKVVSNVSKAKKITAACQEDINMTKFQKRNSMTNLIELEEICTGSSVVGRNVENITRHNEEKEKTSKDRNSLKNTVLSDFTKKTTSPYKRIQKDACTEGSQNSSISSCQKIDMLKSPNSRAEKNEGSNLEISWKNQVIGRFLKMTKNEIYHMVNNTSRRKFDVIMKRLVKEKRPTLSLEMRHAQDEKMRLYDQQEFMKQLNAMLEPDATVAITDLPNEFIHHLNEVLQLDIPADNHTEQSPSGSTSFLEDLNHMFDPVMYAAAECATETMISNEVNQDCVRNENQTTITVCDKDLQAHNIKSNDFNTKDDACSTKSNRSNTSSKLSTLQHDVDDIFSEVKRKNQAPAASMRKDCIADLPGASKSDDGAVSRHLQKGMYLEDDRSHRSENCARWIEKCDGWKRNSREDPYAYRNLTKEEWEAKYGIQTNSTSPSSVVKKINDDKNLSNKIHTRTSYQRRRHSSESSKHPSSKHKTAESKHKRSRRHSDERKQIADHPEDSSSGSSYSTSSSSTRSSSSSSDSSNKREPNVTKLLRVIKEKEKVAKMMSLNETIRDEVNAEIERERKQKGKKSHKSHKSAKRQKEKREHHKRNKKQKEKAASSSDLLPRENDNEITASKLLTGNEIKTESIQDQVMQEVIIKEELDIGQDENTADVMLGNSSSHQANTEDKTSSLPPKFQDRLESPLIGETSMMTADTIQSHAKDKAPTSSPTQPKTKAQLKQMPETADTDDNKASLNILSGVFEDQYSMINSANISECSGDSNKHYQTIDVNYDGDKTEIDSAMNNLTIQSDNIDNNLQTSRDKSDENPIYQSDATVCISTESANATSIPDDNEISADISNKTSTPSMSGVLITNTAAQKQGTSRKIDIKTYYERTIQRRMNEQGETKKHAEETATITQNSLSTPKSAEMEVAVNKSAFASAHHSSVEDPRLTKSSIVSHSTSSKENIVAAKSGKYIQQERIKEPEIAESALKYSEESFIANTKSAIKTNNKCESEHQLSHPANTNIVTLSNVVTTSGKRNTTQKSKKLLDTEANLTGKKPQKKTKVPSDSKKFKNIRSEGSKELKLKKEMAKTLKMKKKPTVKSTSLVSTKIYYPEKTGAEETKNVAQQKEIDINDANKINMEWNTAEINPYVSKINNNNTEVEPSKISSENNDNRELPHDTNKTEECLLELKFIESRNIEKDTGNIDKQISSATQNEDPCNIEYANDTLNVEIANKENHDIKLTLDIVSEFGIPTDSTISNPKTQISDVDTNETGKEKLSLINENQQPNVTKNMELSNEIQTNKVQSEELNKQDLSECTNVPTSIEKCYVNIIPEIDRTSQLDIIDIKGGLQDTCGSVIKDETGKIAESSISKKHSQGEEGNGVISPDSAGSPFRGFHQESITTFEQPNLFNIELDEIGTNKKDKLLSDNCSISCIIDTESCKETKIERQGNCEMLESSTGYANNIGTNDCENITFGDHLLASDKDMNRETDKSDIIDENTMNNNREESIERSPNEIVTATLQEDSNVNINEDSEMEKQLIIEETSNTELTVKETVFINEEETMQDESRSKDFTDKLTTATDPNLSDALNTTASDETLRLPEMQSTEHLDNHVYLETNISSEKISCDKLPGFDSDEHLDNMFYLDVPLQSTNTFNDKDDPSVHFSHHQQSPQYEITPTITPETTTIAPCSDSSHDETQNPEQCKFNFKRISPIDNDCNFLTTTSMEHLPIDVPRTLNIPTKAALKETARNLFLKSPNNMSRATEKDGIAEKTQQDETINIYQTPTWHLNIHNNLEIQKENGDNIIAQDITNINTVSSTQCNVSDVSVHEDVNTAATVSLATSVKDFRGIVHRSPVIELKKVTELDNKIEKKTEKDSKKVENVVYRKQKRREGSFLQKLKDNRLMKHRNNPSHRKNLLKKFKNMKQAGSFNTKEAILARMLEIDIEMHKLSTEKLKLHEMLQNDATIPENSASNADVLREKKNENATPVQSEILPILTLQSAQNSTETNDAELNKHLSPLKQSPNKQRKRTTSHSSEDEEIMHYTQKIKTPVIRWKKIPRLDQTIKRKDQEEKQKKDQDKRTEEQTSLPLVIKTADDVINSSRDVIQEPELHTMTDHDEQVQQTSVMNDGKADCDTNKFAESTICSSETTHDRPSEPQESTEKETDNVEHLPICESSNVDKKNDGSALSEVTRANSRSSITRAHSTPEPLSIYSDDSTWDSLVQNTASEMHEKRKSTGLALLEETFRKELAISRKMKTFARKQKKKQLDNFLKSVNKLTVEEEHLPLSKLYIRKLQQKRDLLDTLSQRKIDVAADPKTLDNMEKVINAVAENRVEDLYGSQPEARASNDIPTTCNVSSVSQPEEHQLLVDAEANANSDWPCQEKESVEEIAFQQHNSDDISGADGSSHVFTTANQNKVPVYDERNVEPDSSATSEETLMESHSSNLEHMRSKELSNVSLRNFDIKVSVPKILIKDNFSLGLLQKFKDTTDTDCTGVGLIESTTNAFNAINANKSEENKEDDKIRQDTPQTAKSIVEEDKNEEKSEPNIYEKDEHAINSNKRDIASRELQKPETTDSGIKDVQSIVQSDNARTKYSDIIGNENSDDSVALSGYDKVATDIIRDISSSNSITKNIEVECAVQNSPENVDNMIAIKEEKSNSRNESYTFKKILINQCTNSPAPSDLTDLASERSEESNISIEERRSPGPAVISALSFSKAIRNIEINKKPVHRRKHDKPTVVRRSSRYINENVKPNKIIETDTNSNSSEANIHERELTTRRKSKSPLCDERIINTSLNAKRNRASQKSQNTNSRKMFRDTESTMDIENPTKSHSSAFIVASKNKIVIDGKKRKERTKWQMMNCKVRLIDCKHTLLKPNISSEILREFGIIIINPYTPVGSLCDRNTPVIPAAISEKDFLPADNLDDKDKVEIEILGDISIKKDNEDNVAQESTSHVIEVNEQEPTKTQYTVHKGPILDIKVFENSFLAASEDGKIYRYSQKSNGILNIYKGHKSAVTCLYIYKSDVANVNKELMYSGSLDGTLRCYNITTGALIKNPVQINSPIQCMDQSWGLIFVGTKSGHVSRFHIKTSVIKGSSIQFSDKSVLALKASNEGPRRILIVASRNQPITIRDAQTGLFLRTISSQRNHTVYSLMRHHNLIYCGTSSTSINVFDFSTGEQTVQYDAGVGIVCMRLYDQLLFAGCYDGNIYVFNTTNHQLICSIPGPGNMLLSIEVVCNKIIAGSKDKRLHSWPMPSQVRALLHKTT